MVDCVNCRSSMSTVCIGGVCAYVVVYACACLCANVIRWVAVSTLQSDYRGQFLPSCQLVHCPAVQCVCLHVVLVRAFILDLQRISRLDRL